MKEFHVFTKLIRQWLSNGLHVEILSSGTSGKDIFHEVCRQKDEWLDTWGLSILPAHYAMGSSEKQKWAAPDILLIDDYGNSGKIERCLFYRCNLLFHCIVHLCNQNEDSVV